MVSSSSEIASLHRPHSMGPHHRGARRAWYVGTAHRCLHQPMTQPKCNNDHPKCIQTTRSQAGHWPGHAQRLRLIHFCLPCTRSHCLQDNEHARIAPSPPAHNVDSNITCPNQAHGCSHFAKAHHPLHPFQHLQTTIQRSSHKASLQPETVRQPEDTRAMAHPSKRSQLGGFLQSEKPADQKRHPVH